MRCYSATLLKGGDRITPLLPGNLYVGTKLERLERGLFAGVQAVEFGEGHFVLLLFHENMDKPSARLGIIGLKFQIISVRASGFGLFLSVEALRQSSARFRLLRLNFQRAPKSCFRFVRLALAEHRPSQVINRRDVVGIKMKQGLEGFGSAGPVARSIQRNC